MHGCTSKVMVGIILDWTAISRHRDGRILINRLLVQYFLLEEPVALLLDIVVDHAGEFLDSGQLVVTWGINTERV